MTRPAVVWIGSKPGYALIVCERCREPYQAGHICFRGSQPESRLTFPPSPA